MRGISWVMQLGGWLGKLFRDPMSAIQQLIAPELGIGRFSNLLVRSQLEWCSPAPGEFDR